MGGHTSLLDSSYKQFDSEVMHRRLKEEFDKHIGCLSIFESGPDLAETQIEIELLKKDKQEMQKTVEEMKYQILQLQVEKQAQNGKSLEELIKKFLKEKK